MPAGDTQITVRGLRELNQALARADRESRLYVRDEFRRVAEPIRREAESLAEQRIRRIGTKWPKMRTGITRRVVYVAPRQRGIKRGDDPRKRPKFGTLLMGRAMEPALERHAADVERSVEHALDRIADHFNGGPT